MRWYSALLGVLLTTAAWGQQGFEFFTARQGVSAVLQQAQRDGFTGAKPLWVAYVGSVPGVNLPLTPRFDLERGRANYWLYGVQAGDSTPTYAVVRVQLVGFIAQRVPLPTLPGGILLQPLPPSWMDSDSLVVLLRQNLAYQDFRRQYPDSLPDLVTLGMGVLPGITTPIPLWTVSFLGPSQDSDATMVCTAYRDPAVGEGVECLRGPSSVEPEADPQPRYELQSGMLLVELPPQWCVRGATVRLLTLLGQELARSTTLQGECRVRLRLPAMAAGAYVLQVMGAGAPHQWHRLLWLMP
jgi:hypothetical protein